MCYEPVVLPLLALAACVTAPETGDRWLVGRVLGADGAPLVGLRVESLEASATTDADGAFAVAWQAPNHHAHFEWRGVIYARGLQPGDAGTVVELPLPPQRQVGVQCPQEDCALELSWPLQQGFTASVSTRCSSGEVLPARHVPVAEPEVRCTVGRGTDAREAAYAFDDRGEVLALGPPLQSLRVELRSEAGPLPDRCVVHVGDRVAQRAGPGFWTAEASGRVTVGAVCEGRPAAPVGVEAGAESVALLWSPTGPALQLQALAPGARGVELLAEAAEGGWWRERFAPAQDGSFPLPALAPGTYRVLVHGEDPVDLASAGEPPAGREGALELVPVDGTDAWLGRLVLARDLVDGDLPGHVVGGR